MISVIQAFTVSFFIIPDDYQLLVFFKDGFAAFKKEENQFVENRVAIFYAEFNGGDFVWFRKVFLKPEVQRFKKLVNIVGVSPAAYS